MEGVKMEKRYESDLTRKEKFELEKKKLSTMNKKEKIAYIWEYYKLAIFGVIGFIAVIIVVLQIYEHSKYENLIYMGVVNSSFSENLEEAQKEILDVVGTGDKYEEAYIDTSLMMGRNVRDAEPVINMKFQTQIAARAIDILLCNEGIWKDYEKLGFFADLSELIPEEEWEEYGISKGDTKMKLENSRFLNKYNLVLYKEGYCYATIIANSKHMDEAVKMLKYMKEEE